MRSDSRLLLLLLGGQLAIARLVRGAVAAFHCQTEGGAGRKVSGTLNYKTLCPYQTIKLAFILFF